MPHEKGPINRVMSVSLMAKLIQRVSPSWGNNRAAKVDHGLLGRQAEPAQMNGKRQRLEEENGHNLRIIWGRAECETHHRMQRHGDIEDERRKIKEASRTRFLLPI